MRALDEQSRPVIKQRARKRRKDVERKRKRKKKKTTTSTTTRTRAALTAMIKRRTQDLKEQRIRREEEENRWYSIRTPEVIIAENALLLGGGK